MENNELLIFIDDKDKTDEINSIELINEKYQISFTTSEKTYSYGINRIKTLKLNKKINPETHIIKINNSGKSDIKAILDYGSVYKIIFDNNQSRLYEPAEVSIENNCLCLPHIKKLFACFGEIAHNVGLESNNTNLLKIQYDKLTQISEESIVSQYLDSTSNFEPIHFSDTLIYPFGINQSQKIAVEQAFSSRASIVQGPPGTGKTQTILNILANILCQGKTVAVVSNNNSATQNVVDKLSKQELSFLTAFLGSNEKKTQFIEKQQLMDILVAVM